MNQRMSSVNVLTSGAMAVRAERRARWLRRVGRAMILCAACTPLACANELPAETEETVDEPHVVPEKRCGESPDTYFSAYTAADLEALSDCTILVGRFQQDSVGELEDFAALKHVWKIEGALNVFRSPGFVTLHGLENLELVEGDLYIHLNPNLQSVAALAKLRTVTGNLQIAHNEKVPQAEVEAIGALITVGGQKKLE